MKPVTFLVVGAGDRGATYTRLASELDGQAKVVALAEPRQERREVLVAAHGIAQDMVFEDWSEAAAAEPMADAVIIATPDGLHAEPTFAFLERGYHVLLEKPMATTEALCRQIAEAAEAASGQVFAVAHVLRYTDYTTRIKRLIASGVVGDVMAIQRLEPIGYDHFAHSYVRGNWRRESESSFSLLTKASHDLDWIRFVLGQRCRRLSSFAELRHFRADARPEGAADRCLDCPVERTCPYSAKKIYVDRAVVGERGWPLSVVVPDPTANNLIEALRTGPYGRCVYSCDNDVADTQVVNMSFEGGAIATFIMTAFAPRGLRKTTIFGSKGMLLGDGRFIEHVDFLTDKSKTIDTAVDGEVDLAGHGGGDRRLLEGFVAAVAGDRHRVLSGPDNAVESHAMVFAAERARRDGTVVELD